MVGQPANLKLARNRLVGHVSEEDLAGNVMDQNRTSGPRRGESALGPDFRLARDSPTIGAKRCFGLGADTILGFMAKFF